MGQANYRTKAKLEAEKDVFEAAGMTCGAVSMCGWRKANEDAHLVDIEFQKGMHLFGVFDGHGGKAVSKCVAAKLPEMLRENELFKKKNYAEALRSVFMQMDEYLDSEEGRAKLVAYNIKTASEEEDEDDQMDLNQLLQDPEMLSQLGMGGLANLANMQKAGEGEEEDEEVSGEEKSEDAEEGDEKAEKAEGEEDDDEDSDDSDFDPDAEYPDDEGEDDDEMPADDDGPTPEDQGCTAVVALLDFTDASHKTLYVANAGDSRAILAKDNDAVGMSDDHKPSLPEETARIEAAGSTVTSEMGDYRVNGELNLSRALGDLRFKQSKHVKKEDQAVTAMPDIKTMQLHSECKFLVLACDGIFEKYENSEVISHIREGVTEAKTGDDLCAVAEKFMLHNVAKDPSENEGLGCDNMSMVICKLPTDQLPDINSMRETRPRKVPRLA